MSQRREHDRSPTSSTTSSPTSSDRYPEPPPTPRYDSSSPTPTDDDAPPRHTPAEWFARAATAPRSKRARTDGRAQSPGGVSGSGGGGGGGGGASWERHTRGIGSYILARQGFTGRLGKNADGASKPLVQKVRRRNVGVGADQHTQKHSSSDDDQHQHQQPGPTSTPSRPGPLQKRAPRGDPPVSKPPPPPPPPRTVTQEEVADALFTASHVSANFHILANGARARVAACKRRHDAETTIRDNISHELARATHQREEAELACKAYDDSHAMLVRLQAVAGAVCVPSMCEEVELTFTDAVTLANECGVEEVRKLLAGAVSETIVPVLRKAFHDCLTATMTRGKADMKSVAIVLRLLSLMAQLSSDVDLLSICAKCLLRPLQVVVTSPSWDVVRGACLADLLLAMKDTLPDAIVTVFVDEVLAPRLQRGAQTLLLAATGDADAVIPPTNVWVLPWVAVAGRRALVDTLHVVRLHLTQRLRVWRLGVDNTAAKELASEVAQWNGILSRTKLQISLNAYIVPKLVNAIAGLPGDQEMAIDTSALAWTKIKDGMVTWRDLGSARVFSNAISVPLLNVITPWIQRVSFATEGGWEQGCAIYKGVLQWLSADVKQRLRGTLAILLFVIHASRMTRGVDRLRCVNMDLSALQTNAFARSSKSAQKEAHKEKDKESDMMEDDGKRLRLTDVLAAIGEREGLEVVGMGMTDSGDMKAFRVGHVVVTVDLRQNVLLLNKRIVTIDEVVSLVRANANKSKDEKKS